MSSTPENTEVEATSGAAVLLTVEGILRLKADYESDLKLQEELPARIKQKKRLYEAALLFAPPGFNPDAPICEARTSPATAAHLKADDLTPKELTGFTLESSPSFSLTALGPVLDAQQELPNLTPLGDHDEIEEEDEQGGRITWIGETRRILNEAMRGMSHSEVLTALKSLPLKGSTGDKGFYNAVARLEKRGDLIKAGGLLYAKRVVEDMGRRGEKLPDMSIENRRRAGGSGSFALDVVRSNPQGLSANEIREGIAKMPGAPESIVKHAHYIYNVLATLIGQGVITKGADGLYRLADTQSK